MDLVSYNGKNNDILWPFGPSDGGADSNLSWDSGGDHALRRQRLRNFLTVLFFSRGVPMIVSGDEFGRTQNGNNNPVQDRQHRHVEQLRHDRHVRADAVPTGGSGAYHDNYGDDGNSHGRNGLFLFLRFLTSLRRARQPSSATFGDLCSTAVTT